MDVQKNKALSRIIQCFFFFLVLRVLEELIIIPRANTLGLISTVGGLIVLLIYIRFINKPLDEIGMIFSGHKVRKGIVLALLLNIIPAGIVYWTEYHRYSQLNGFTRITAFYQNTSHAYSVAGLRNFIFWIAAGLLVGIVTAFFYELSFRGLLITLGSRSLKFWAINLIQAALYTVWYLLPVLRVVIYNFETYGKKRILMLLFVTLAYEMITAIKLGLLRYSTGSVWVCIFDHFAFGVILDMIHVQYTTVDMQVLTDNSYYTRILAYQGIALLFTIVYTYFKSKKIHEMQRDMQLHQQNT